MLRLALLPIAVTVIAGCASPPSGPAPQGAVATDVADANASERKQICVREQPIGSAIPTTKCHYEETGTQRALNVDAFEHAVHSSTRTGVPGS